METSLFEDMFFVVSYFFDPDFVIQTCIKRHPNKNSYLYEKLWCDKLFVKGEQQKEIDLEMRKLFLDLYYKYKDASIEYFIDNELDLLGSVLLFDQIPRNIFRNTKQMYDTDVKALEIVGKGLIKFKLFDIERAILGYPFIHSENLNEQLKAKDLYNHIIDPYMCVIARYFRIIARNHYDTIQIFGRFPQRNNILGRISTLKEIVYLRNIY